MCISLEIRANTQGWATFGAVLYNDKENRNVPWSFSVKGMRNRMGGLFSILPGFPIWVVRTNFISTWAKDTTLKHLLCAVANRKVMPYQVTDRPQVSPGNGGPCHIPEDNRRRAA